VEYSLGEKANVRVTCQKYLEQSVAEAKGLVTELGEKFFMKWYLYDSTPPWEAKPTSSNKTDGYSENPYFQESPSPSTTDSGLLNNVNDNQPSSSTAGSAASCAPESFVPIDDSSTNIAETAAPCPLESSRHDSQRPSDRESFTGSVSEAISPDCAQSPGTPVEASCYLQKSHS